MTLKITGYTPKWNYKPGDRVPLHISSEHDEFYVSLARFHGAIGNDNSWVNACDFVAIEEHGPFPGAALPIITGSHIDVDGLTCGPVTCARVGAWFESLPETISTLLHVSTEHDGFDLVIDGRGYLSASTSGPVDRDRILGTQVRLSAQHWWDIGFALSLDGGLTLFATRAGQTQRESVHLQRSDRECGPVHALSIGGKRVEDAMSPRALRGDLDAKVELLRLWTADDLDLNAILDGSTSPSATWEFDAVPYKPHVPSTVAGFPAACLINGPTRGVTSSAWDGTKTNFREAPTHYAAAYLHDDDLEDTGWPKATELQIPLDARSGAYTAVLSRDRVPDFNDPTSFYPIPIFVEPGRDASNRIAVVLPTFSYRAYANNTKYADADPAVFELKGPTRSAMLYEFCLDKKLRSQYCTHADGSGVHLATLLRPQVTVRHDLVSQLHSFPHQLSSDLEIIEWLESLGVGYDILTDERLHEDGHEALGSYRVVLTGSHPEYCTGEVLDAYSGHLRHGGQMMYLGGNGFILRVTIDNERPWIQELRRGDLGVIWDDAPGEFHHQQDGRRGGLWRTIGRPPNVLVDLGYAAIGFTGDGTYEVPAGAAIDNLPSRLRQAINEIGDEPFGVAGLELDAHDVALRSDVDAVVFGTLHELPPRYKPAVAEAEDGDPEGPRIESHLSFRRTDSGGAVVAFGSIRWTSGLNLPGDPTQVRSITTAALLDLLQDDAAVDAGEQ